MFHTTDVCIFIPAPNPIVDISKSTYILASFLIAFAIIQWYALQAFFENDLFRWSTPMMVIAFIMVTIFYNWPSVRHGFPYNMVYVIGAMELMILGAGLMSADLEGEVLLSVTAASAFTVIVMIIIGIFLQENMDANPFCYLTSFFFCMMTTAILLYMHLALHTGVVLKLGYLIVLYTISSMIVYHSMVVKSGQLHLYEDDFVLMGMLFCVDFICLFLLAAMFFQDDVQGSDKFDTFSEDKYF